MNDAKQLMQKYGLRPKKFLGQNFLVDKNVLEKILAAADLSKNDIVLEVGPGPGILTEKLAERAGRVIAVEKDKKLAEILKKQFLEIKNVEIIQGDILKEIKNLKLKIKNYKVVANIPYYLTSHLIRKFLESANPPTQMILMIQKEVAERICAKPLRLRQGYGGQAKMSLLAVSVQFYAQPKIISYVSKNSFWPKPKVDSAIIKITPYSSPLYKRGARGDFKIPPNLPLPKGGVNNFFRVAKAGFSQPRKQLINNLSCGLKIERPKIAAILKKIGLAPQQRAETLKVEDWIGLAKLL